MKLIFGKKDKDGKLVYVKREVGKDMAGWRWRKACSARVGEGRVTYLEKTIPSYPTDEEIVKLTVERDGKTYELEREKRGDAVVPVWKFLQPPELAGRLADEFKVTDCPVRPADLKPRASWPRRPTPSSWPTGSCCGPS